MAGSSNFLFPEDSVTEILLRLPVKSLLRFKSVCKQWHSIISSPSFSYHHFHHESNPTQLVVHWSGKVQPYENHFEDTVLAVSSFLDETLERHEEPDHLKLPWDVAFFLGPCKGIFCLSSWLPKVKFALWKPATRRLRPLPNPPVGYEDFGFGLDPFTDELKLVVILGFICWHPDFAIYTSSSDSWRCSRKETLFDHHQQRKACLMTSPCINRFMDGFCYWLAFDMTEDRHSFILAFDIHNEVFQEIQVPEAVRSREQGHLDPYSGSLTLFSYENDSYSDQRIDIWKMEEGGRWTNLSTVVVLPFQFMYPVGLWKSNQILVVSEDMEVMICDLHGQHVRNLGIKKKGEGVRYESIWISYYKESLTSLKESHGLEDYDIHSSVSLDFFLPDPLT